MTKRNVTHATVTLARHYESSPDRVFAAWADPKTKVGWFANDAPGYRLDFRVGGLGRNAASLDGKEITWEALYPEIVPNERIVYSAVLYEGDVAATVSQASVELMAEDGGTALVLTEQGAYLDGREQPEWREQGTADWLDALGRHLDAPDDATQS
jgi:uncharacterized protein YndB with AHSA1/START domain